MQVLRTQLVHSTPICGVELTPYVLLRLGDQTCTTEDVNESSPVEGQYVQSRWFRSSGVRRAMCSVHHQEQATIQCVQCVKAKAPISKSYHCGPECFTESWDNHKAIHQRAIANGGNENGGGQQELYRGDSSKFADADGWIEISRKRTYIPAEDDVGHTLKYECQMMDAKGNTPIGQVHQMVSSRVLAPPEPKHRQMLTLDRGGLMYAGKFTLLTWNVLADLYATTEMYTYCEPWALSWNYRRQNLLKEILSYEADILCLQEVQSDHYTEFFAPELQKHGYAGVYKKKTTEVFTGSSYAIDGCATFFRTDRFALVKKYEVEFNKAALSLSEALGPTEQKKAALNRLLKDNVALIVVIEALEPPEPEAAAASGKRQLICVANTHIHANPELKDVKLWQVHTLLKGLEKIAASADIPMLVAGDFNSTPGSAPHSLLSQGRVDAGHPELATDPLGILRPPSKLCHSLPLVSAYTSLATHCCAFGV
mmetsp:Transcript_5147/g.16836  ORF Transcript_5147/g.16836 Transcript_5147/m.16836 type:complete len:482 (-) Transcript_5147:46-1491(-)